MIRCDGFGRSLVFAAGAAAGCLPWALLAVPLLGAWPAQACYLILVTAAYAAGIAPRRRGGHRALRTALAAGLAGALLALGARTTAELAIGLAVLLGVLRSGFLYRAAPARAAATETVLLVGGLLFARALTGASLPSTALALWGFLLVQSCFFLVPAVRRRPAEAAAIDPFEAAYRDAVALLDRTAS